MTYKQHRLLYHLFSAKSTTKTKLIQYFLQSKKTDDSVFLKISFIIVYNRNRLFNNLFFFNLYFFFNFIYTRFLLIKYMCNGIVYKIMRYKRTQYSNNINRRNISHITHQTDLHEYINNNNPYDKSNLNLILPKL